MGDGIPTAKVGHPTEVELPYLRCGRRSVERKIVAILSVLWRRRPNIHFLLEREQSIMQPTICLHLSMPGNNPPTAKPVNPVMDNGDQRSPGYHYSQRNRGLTVSQSVCCSIGLARSIPVPLGREGIQRMEGRVQVGGTPRGCCRGLAVVMLD